MFFVELVVRRNKVKCKSVTRIFFLRAEDVPLYV